MNKLEYTAQMVLAEITEEDKRRALECLAKNTEVPEFLKTLRKFQDVFIAGNWLSSKLYRIGCPVELAQDIGTSLGQRCVFGNPYEWAAKYWNMYQDGGKYEKPGKELADRIVRERIRPVHDRASN